MFCPLEALRLPCKPMASSRYKNHAICNLCWGWGVVRDCGVSGDSGQPSIWARTRAVHPVRTLPSLPVVTCSYMATNRSRYIGVWTSVDTLRWDPLTLEALEIETLEHPWNFEKLWPGTVKFWIFWLLWRDLSSLEKLEIFEYPWKFETLKNQMPIVEFTVPEPPRNFKEWGPEVL